MRNISYIIFLFFIYITANLSCKKPYNPPAVKVDNRFLVVDGTLLNSADSPTVITLSRTVRLTDTTTATSPESGASVSVEGSAGESFIFNETPGGIYKSNPLVLSTSDKYRLKITTSNGEAYTSDFVEVKQTQPIDSVTWHQQNDVMIYVNTHDPSNSTKYYRWDFVETWQYRAPLDRTIAQNNGFIYYVDSTNKTYNCWSTHNSTDILLGSTIALSQDVIINTLIETVPQNSDKIGIRYSILVKQYALSEKAYQYLSILKKNTENLGSIFDAQPTQLIGNIHSVKNSSEIVVGYFTASSVQQQRIFINADDVSDWNPVYTGRSCDMVRIPQDPNNYLIYNYEDTAFQPYYFESMPDLIVLTRTECVDCRTRGGTTTKPSFW